MEGATLWPADWEEDGIGMGSSSNCRPFFPLLIHLFVPTAILPQPQPQLPRWGLGAREVEWLAALHRGVSTVAAAPRRMPPARPLDSVLHSAHAATRSPALCLCPLRRTPLALLRTSRPPHAASLPPLHAAVAVPPKLIWLKCANHHQNDNQG